MDPRRAPGGPATAFQGPSGPPRTSGSAPQLYQVALQALQRPLLLLELVAERVAVPVEQLDVPPRHLLAVAGVDADRIVADPPGEPEPAHRGAGQPHADAELPAQVDGALGLLIPGISARRRRAVPLLQHETDIDVLLQAADPQLLAARADQRGDRRQRPAGRVRVDGRVVDPEYPAVRSNRDDQLQQPAAHGYPLRTSVPDAALPLAGCFDSKSRPAAPAMRAETALKR